MPHVQAVVFVPWKVEAGKNKQPDVVDEIYVWAGQNDQRTPQGPYGWRIDVTGQPKDSIVAGKVFATLLVVGLATAQQFQSDPRMFRLGWRIFDNDGELQFSNWDQPLDAPSRTQALDWLEAHGYTRAQVAARFDATDTRKEILDKLREMFRE